MPSWSRAARPILGLVLESYLASPKGVVTPTCAVSHKIMVLWERFPGLVVSAAVVLGLVSGCRFRAGSSDHPTGSSVSREGSMLRVEPPDLVAWSETMSP